MCHDDPVTVPSWVVLNAVRYAIGRATYVVGQTCEMVRAVWKDLDEHTRPIILRDLQESADRDSRVGWDVLGMDCDRREWLALLDWIKAQEVAS